MSTIVCQNIVSCFESQLTETTTTLKLRVAAPPPPPPAASSQNLGISSTDNRPQASEAKANPQFGNWGFLQTTPKETGDDNCYTTYTHPSSETTSFSRLSAQSLQLCTENLGSETGTDIITDGCTIFSSSSSPPPFTAASPISDQIPLCRSRAESDDCNQRAKKLPNSCREIKNFPPPLTSMSGGASSLRHHREGGRLIIEAVEAPFRNSYLQAERCDGRLRLCFLTAAGAGEQEHDDDDGEEEGEEQEQEQGVECGVEMAVETGEEETEEEEPVSEIESENEESINLEIEKYQWLRRCNEGGHGNKGLCSSWKHALWVATS